MEPIIMGNYKIVHAKSLTSGCVFYLVYANGIFDPLSEHEQLVGAKNAVKRYMACDKRRATYPRSEAAT